MLRSSSTPLFGSLLSESSISGSPQLPEKNTNPTLLQYRHRPHPMPLAASFGNSSPLPSSILDHSSKSFRRAHSESNLTSLAASHHSSLECSREEDDEDEDIESDDDAPDDSNPGFFIRRHAIEKEHISDGWGSGGGRGGAFSSRLSSGDGEEINQTEQHYKRMMQDDPSNPLILKNYAQFLLQAKGDLKGAETLCSRAILSDPEDGDVLALYAEVSWRLHHDEEKCVFYFDQAAKVSPENSHVHAAYARFLWEVEEDDDQNQFCPDFYQELCI